MALCPKNAILETVPLRVAANSEGELLFREIVEVGILVCPTVNVEESEPKAGFLISLLVMKGASRGAKD